jgi:hypothetical protein
MCKLTVIENNAIGFIFGLDNMRSHRCSIDLAKHSLIFQDAGFSVNFLSDGEIKKMKVDEEEEIVNELKSGSKKELEK